MKTYDNTRIDLACLIVTLLGLFVVWVVVS